MTIFQVDSLPIPQARLVGVDIETTMLSDDIVSDPFNDRIISIQISDGKDTWVVRSNFESIQPLFAAKDIIKIIHNSSFDLSFLVKQAGAKIDRSSLWDSLLVERVINAGNDISNALDATLARRMGVMLDKTTRRTFVEHSGPLTEAQLRYVEGDVVHLPKLYELQLADVEKNLLGRVVGVENRIAPLVVDMSLHGIRFDQTLWESYVPQIRNMLREIENSVGSMAGLPQENALFENKPRTAININSTQQMQALFKQLGFEIRTRDREKKLTTNKKAIAEFIQDNPDFKYRELLEMVTDYRAWSHMLSTPYNDSVNPIDGKIHCSWNQIQADTGRFSSSDPNMQNVERPRKDRPNLRNLFLPESDDYTFLIADYNQQEPRIFAQISGDQNLREACMGIDVYIGMAKRLYKVDVTKDDPRRQNVKTGVLADFYGAQPATLASHMKISLDEAETFHRNVGEQFPEARRWSTRIQNSAMSSGMTRTLLGRIRHFPDVVGRKMTPHLASQFVNTPIQGSGADLFKLALDKFGNVCEDRKYNAYPSIAVHDELVVQCRKDEADEVYYQLIGAMEEAGAELCPDVIMLADGLISERWTKT